MQNSLPNIIKNSIQCDSGCINETQFQDKLDQNEKKQSKFPLPLIKIPKDQQNIDQDQSKQKLETAPKTQIMKLKQILNIKIQATKQLKKKVQTCKKQMQQIGDQVDKQMSKSIIRQTKPHPTIDIHQIFSTSKSSNPKTNNLIMQLTRLRNQCKKTKQQIKISQHTFIDPINILTNQRTTKLKQKIKQIQLQLKNLYKQKQYLSQQLSLQTTQSQNNQIINKQQYQNYLNNNQTICNQIKKQKYFWYTMDKQDRLLTQKIKFIEDLQSNYKNKKNRTTLSSCNLSKQQIQDSAHLIIQQINELTTKRNKVENQRKTLLKTLQSHFQQAQQKNEQMTSKLKNIDVTIIQHHSKLKRLKYRKNSLNQFNKSTDKNHNHNHKTKQNVKSNFIKIIKTVHTTNNNHNHNNSNNNNSLCLSQKSKNKQISIINQNQLKQITQYIQTHKTYNFFMNPNNPISDPNKICLSNVLMSDQIFINSKLILKSLNFVVDANSFYGLYAEYQNQHSSEVKGYKIMPRIRPKTAMLKKLLICQQQLINSAQVGTDENQFIRYIFIITSEQRQFKWGNPGNCVKKEQQNIQKYESLTIKGKLSPIVDKEAPNYYCLTGIGFDTMSLSPV